MHTHTTFPIAALLLCLASASRVAAEPRSVEEIAKAAKDSVVTIRFTGRRASDEGLGTGFVVGDGLVATNLHVIGEARPITVELADGSTHEATAVHATDRDADLAIVRINVRGLTPLPLADAGTVVDGQEVVAVGNPHGPSPARAAASARPATAGTWHRRRRTSPITSSRRCPCGSG